MNDYFDLLLRFSFFIFIKYVKYFMIMNLVCMMFLDKYFFLYMGIRKGW